MAGDPGSLRFFESSTDALEALSPIERMRIADLSEAAAYRTLIDCDRAAHEPGFEAAEVGRALVLRSEAVRSSVLFNRVIGAGAGEEITTALLDQIAQHYAGMRTPWAIEVSAPVDSETFRGWLKERRMRRGLPTALLMRSCTDVPDVATDLRVEQTGAEFSSECTAIWTEVFRLAAPVQALLAHASSQPGFRQWVAFDGDRPVACSLSHLAGETAWLGWSATLETHRGRGAQNALLAARIRDAGHAGCSWVTSETAMGTPEQPDPSYRNVLRFGFRLAYQRYMYVGMPR